MDLELTDEQRDEARTALEGSPDGGGDVLAAFSDEFAEQYVDDVARQVALQNELGDDGYNEWITAALAETDVRGLVAVRLLGRRDRPGGAAGRPRRVERGPGRAGRLSRRPRIVVAGLGPGGPDLVSAGTLAAIERIPHRWLRTARHPAASVAGRRAHLRRVTTTGRSGSTTSIERSPLT